MEIFRGTPPFFDGSLVYSNPESFQGIIAEQIIQRQRFFEAINRRRLGTVALSKRPSHYHEFRPGDLCYVKNFRLQFSPQRQLEAKFLGPFKIAKKLNAFCFLIDFGSGVEKKVHIQALRPYNPTHDVSKPATEVDPFDPDLPFPGADLPSDVAVPNTINNSVAGPDTGPVAAPIAGPRRGRGRPRKTPRDASLDPDARPILKRPPVDIATKSGPLPVARVATASRLTAPDDLKDNITGVSDGPNPDLPMSVSLPPPLPDEVTVDSASRSLPKRVFSSSSDQSRSLRRSKRVRTRTDQLSK